MKLQQDLVSLIVPFYNAEKYLARFLDSVLIQTYTNIQFILVDDGSTDGSNSIVENYRASLEKRLKNFLYLKQDNGGAAKAVNNALKYVEGEYLTWADSDDVLHKDNIKLKYNYLKNNSSYGLVMCGAQAIDQKTSMKLYNLVLKKKKRSENMFRTIIDGIPCYPGVFMIRTHLLFDKIANREIYFNREAGQNYQLLLPVAYDSKCGFIDNILYDYYVRSDSHSHDVDSKRMYARTFVRETLLDSVLDFLPIDEKQVLIKKIHINSLHNRFEISFSNDLGDENYRTYQELKKEDSLEFKEYVKRIVIQNKILYGIYQSVISMIRLMIRLIFSINIKKGQKS